MRIESNDSSSIIVAKILINMKENDLHSKSAHSDSCSRNHGDNSHVSSMDILSFELSGHKKSEEMEIVTEA